MFITLKRQYNPYFISILLSVISIVGSVLGQKRYLIFVAFLKKYDIIKNKKLAFFIRV
jgi:hypothetical protein